MDHIREGRAFRLGGFLALALNLVVLALSVWIFRAGMLEHEVGPILWGVGLAVIGFLLWPGYFIVQPNEARVLVFLGRYVGSVRDAGFWWTNPLTVKRHVSLRIHNFNSEKLKVNDLQGNPIEIAAVIVWRVVDSAKALFDVENYQGFIAIQSETAIRSLASQYPYDAHDENKASLRGSPNEISENLKQQVQLRLEVAGVEISEGRLTHLAYAPEIAQAMLRRQQAEAIVAARQKIVEGAVGMVESALKMLSEQNIVRLDDEKKAAMTNNLLVALVSEAQAQPILNTGTLYS
jgi:regulator of protease activity HflC (stomatin/prohibitin superfamily)